jgi:cytochrome c
MLRAFVILALTALPAQAQEFFTLKGHGGPIMDIAVASDDQIATASFDNSVGLWTNLTPQWHDAHKAAVNAVTFWSVATPITASDDFDIRFWPTPDSSRILGKHKGKVVDLEYSPKAGLVASASWDGSIGLWPLSTNIGDALYPPLRLGAKDRFITGHSQGVNDVAFNADGTRLYSASIDGTLREWDVKTGEEQQILAKQGFGINEMIVTDTWIAYGAVDGTTRILNHDALQIADFTLDRRPILSMAYSAQTDRLAVGDGEGFIMVIDTENWKIIKDFRATRRGPVWALAFSNDGQNIHAGGIDDVMYSWPVATMDAHDQMGTDTRSFLEDPAKLPNGERQFKRKCSICHSLTQDSQRRAGPTLHNIFGRPAGTLPGYRYSNTLNTSDIVWSSETIDRLFDEGPDHYIPGSKMPMQRITKPQDRLDLIEYLATVTGN